MKSVIEFNNEQTKKFTWLADDVTGASMTSYVLGVLESVAYAIGDIDSILLEDDTREDFEVCMAALEFYRMQFAIKSK